MTMTDARDGVDVTTTSPATKAMVSFARVDSIGQLPLGGVLSSRITYPTPRMV